MMAAAERTGVRTAYPNATRIRFLPLFVHALSIMTLALQGGKPPYRFSLRDTGTSSMVSEESAGYVLMIASSWMILYGDGDGANLTNYTTPRRACTVASCA